VVGVSITSASRGWELCPRADGQGRAVDDPPYVVAITTASNSRSDRLEVRSGASNEMGYDLSRYGVPRVLVVTGAGLAATGIPQRMADL
jgi:hypothetical protein